MAISDKFWEVLYATESAFGEAVTTAGTRLRVIGDTVDVSGLQHPSEPINFVRSYPSEQRPHVRMPQSGSFKVQLELSGLGGSTASSPPASDLVTFLGHVVGNSAAVLSSGTTATGGTATIPTTTAASGASAGGLLRIGALGDTNAEGQWAAVSSHSGNNLTLLTALPDAPAASDVVYCSRIVYPSETLANFEAIQSLRFRLLSRGQQWACHGCYPTSLTFSGFTPGQRPMVEVTFAVAWFEAISVTFPSGVAFQNHSPAPNTGGSLFINTVGTATRVTESARDVEFTVELNNIGHPGPGGAGEYQNIVACSRVSTSAKFSFVVDVETNGTDTWGDVWNTPENSRSNYHALYGLSVGNGRSFAWYSPNMTMSGLLPIGFSSDGTMRQRVEFTCGTGTTTTNDLTLSPWRIAFA